MRFLSRENMLNFDGILSIFIMHMEEVAWGLTREFRGELSALIQRIIMNFIVSRNTEHCPFSFAMLSMWMHLLETLEENEQFLLKFFDPFKFEGA
jgi:hypothetical protein